LRCGNGLTAQTFRIAFSLIENARLFFSSFLFGALTDFISFFPGFSQDEAGLSLCLLEDFF